MVQIRLSRELDDGARAARTPLSVDEFLALFPEVPRDLRDEPILTEYVTAFGPQLRLAQKPTPCMGAGGDAPHAFYVRLVNDLAIYGIGLRLTRPAPRGRETHALPGDRRCRSRRGAPWYTVGGGGDR